MSFEIIERADAVLSVVVSVLVLCDFFVRRG